MAVRVFALCATALPVLINRSDLDSRRTFLRCAAIELCAGLMNRRGVRINWGAAAFGRWLEEGVSVTRYFFDAYMVSHVSLHRVFRNGSTWLAHCWATSRWALADARVRMNILTRL